LDWVASVSPTETNIVIFEVRKPLTEKQVIETLKSKGILISSMGQGKLRMVTHLDYKQVLHEYVLEHLTKIKF
jgi:threonine aldolase